MNCIAGFGRANIFCCPRDRLTASFANKSFVTGNTPVFHDLRSFSDGRLHAAEWSIRRKAVSRAARQSLDEFQSFLIEIRDGIIRDPSEWSSRRWCIGEPRCNSIVGTTVILSLGEFSEGRAPHGTTLDRNTPAKTRMLELLALKTR